jgi:hypothetical protein
MAEDEVKIDFANEEVKKQITEHVTKNYREFIPKELAEDAVMANVPDLVTLAKNYKNAQSLVGRKGLIVPTEKDAPEVWDAFHKALGRPDKDTDYEFEKVEGHTLDLSKMKENFRKQAFANGLNRKATKDLWKQVESHIADSQKVTIDTYKQRIDGEWTELKKEWGGAYDEKIKKINGIVTKFGDADLRDWMKKMGADKEPKLVKFLSKIADGMSEDNTNVSGQPVTYTPAEALSKAKDIMSNKNNDLHEAYLKPAHLRHDEAVKEVERLYRLAYPKEK